MAMDLKSRLGHLQRQAGTKSAAVPPSPSKSLAALQRRLERLPAGRVQSPQRTATRVMPIEDLAKALRGDVIADELIQVRERLLLEGQHGREELSQLKTAYRLPIEEANDCRRVYIDTETTGLSGGSGTVAFLIGIAIVSEEAIELTQLLMTQFSSETTLLSRLTDLLTPDDQLVSYNGKSYDLPLLMTRYRMQGLRHPFDNLPHIDLVHPVRRLFKHRWPDCRLMTVEEKLLGFFRSDDLPGSEAPDAWFRYMRQGNAGRLIRVVEHNRHDILSLAVTHGTLARAIQAPQRYDVDVYSLARWLEETHRHEAVVLLSQHQDNLGDDGLRLLADLYRREACWEEAIPIWERLSDKASIASIERLAKYHEHISKNLQAAWHYCNHLPEGENHKPRKQRVREKLLRLRQVSFIRE
jgi:uncharacterized protein YprB with RNaseH-like and TPR domain